MIWVGGAIAGAILAAGAWIWAIERQLKKPHKGIGE